MKLKPRKTPTTYVPLRAHRGKGVTRNQELQLRRMAGLIQNEAHLSSILMQTKPEMRESGFARLKPYLKFKLREDYSVPAVGGK